MKNKSLFLCAGLLIFLYLLPYFLFGQNSIIYIGDTLDNTLVWLKVLGESGTLFAKLGTSIPQFMNGLPRDASRSEFNIVSILFYFFTPFTAYVINDIVIRLIAFLGMYLLLKNHVPINIPQTSKERIIIGVSLCFAILPFLSIQGLSVPGQPLLLYCLLNIRRGIANVGDWLIISFFPFYSYFPVFGLFIIFAIFVLFIIDIIKERKINKAFLLAICLLTFLYMLCEYRLIYITFFDQNFVPHRNEYDPERFDLYKSLITSLSIFFKNDFHSYSLPTPFILTSIIIALIMAYKKKDQHVKTLIFFVSLALIISFIAGFWRWEGIVALRKNIIFLKAFNITRFNNLGPIIYYIAFVLALSIIFNSGRKGWLIVSLILIFQILLLFANNLNYRQEIKKVTHLGTPTPYITFSEYYSNDLFNNIKEFIGKKPEEYRVLCIGFEPAVAQYNGFYTLDGYSNLYSLGYKHQFRKIIKREIEKNKDLQKIFDDWGCRCYVFVSEIGNNYNIRKDEDIKIKNMELDYQQIASMGGRYILSSVEILNYKDNKLKLLKIFNDDKSVWRIYLYELDISQ